MSTSERRYDIDWLRVIAFYLLILFHTGMLFVPWDWHVKNPETSSAFEPIMAFLHQWRLPLLFFISGVGVRFALKFRSPMRFLGERYIRLMIPLTFGMFVIIPPQIYFENLQNGIVYASYFEFYKTVLEFEPYPPGSFSWHHLWFIIYLFTYCLICLPIFLFLRSERGEKILNKLSGLIKKPGIILLFAIPLSIIYSLLVLEWPVTHNLTEDWYNFFYNIVFFLIGYIVCSKKDFWDTIEKQKYFFLITAVSITTFLYLTSWFPVWTLFTFEGFDLHIYGMLKSINILAWIFLIIGFARRPLNEPSRILKYANESVYPFYILHQTITVSSGYFIVQWNLSIPLKFIIVLVVTFLGSYLIYELFIRRFNLMRLLFGLRLIKYQKKYLPKVPQEVTEI